MCARFDENPAMTLQDIKETKRYGRTDARTDNVRTVYPPQTKFAGGIKTKFAGGINISGSISMKVWDGVGIKLTIPGSEVKQVSAVRHITDCTMRAGLGLFACLL